MRWIRKLLTFILIMGLFSKLFAQMEKTNTDSSVNSGLRLEYNVMENISLDKCKKYDNVERFKFIESGIYEDLKDNDDSKYRMTISYVLEKENETNNQYPLEDILDKYFLYASDFMESENNSDSLDFKIELAGELEDLRNCKEIIGKKVYNQEYKSDDGQIRVNLIIE